MEFKKCERCGCFFVSNDDICCNCKSKDKFEKSELKNYFEDNMEKISINNISMATGISIKNLNRYLSSNEFTQFYGQITDCINNNENEIQL